jgi:hypothetical protein
MDWTLAGRLFGFLALIFISIMITIDIKRMRDDGGGGK